MYDMFRNYEKTRSVLSFFIFIFFFSFLENDFVVLLFLLYTEILHTCTWYIYNTFSYAYYFFLILVTCIPCGHSFCETCLEAACVPVYDAERRSGRNSGESESGSGCPECQGDEKGRTEYYIENQLLENLCARYIFRKQAISSLKNMTNALSKQTGE